MNSEHLGSRTRGGVFAFTLAICALAFVARAQVVAAQAEAGPQTGEYRDLIEQALSEFKHKNWPEARVLFRRAHELSPNARTLRGMGVVSYEMRDYVHAVLELSAALGDTRQPLTETQRKECETLLGRSRTFVGAFALKLEPSTADVTLDGATLARDSEGRALVPFGEHTLRVVAPGYQDSNSKLAVQGGEQGELRIVLYRQEAVAGALSFAPKSSVEKTVLGEGAAAGGPSSGEPSSGPGFRDCGLRYSWVGLGATAAFGAAAAATWFIGQSKVDDLDASCAQKALAGAPCLRGQVDTANVTRFERSTTALLGLTGAALIVTGVLMTLEWPSGRSGERKLALDVAPQRLSVRGNF